MRTQAITTPLDDSGDPAEWRAEAVDPRGWLAGAGSTSAVPRADADRTDGPPAGTPDRATVRTARRNAGARRRRRVIRCELEFIVCPGATERYLSCGDTIAEWKSIECIIGTPPSPECPALARHFGWSSRT